MSKPSWRLGALRTVPLALCEMVIQGVSTRKVEAITEQLCGAGYPLGVSKSLVSKLCQALDPLVKEWRERPLGVFPFVLVDAIVVKVREDKRIKQCSLLIASGIDPDGHRHLLGFALGDKESEASWGALFVDLKARGLSGVDFVISDDQHPPCGGYPASSRPLKGTLQELLGRDVRRISLGI